MLLKLEGRIITITVPVEIMFYEKYPSVLILLVQKNGA